MISVETMLTIAISFMYQRDEFNLIHLKYNIFIFFYLKSHFIQVFFYIMLLEVTLQRSDFIYSQSPARNWPIALEGSFKQDQRCLFNEGSHRRASGFKNMQ